MATNKKKAGRSKGSTFAQRTHAVLGMPDGEHRERIALEFRVGLDATSDRLANALHCADLVRIAAEGEKLLSLPEPESLVADLAVMADEFNAVVAELDRRLTKVEVRS